MSRERASCPPGEGAEFLVQSGLADVGPVGVRPVGVRPAEVGSAEDIFAEDKSIEVRRLDRMEAAHEGTSPVRVDLTTNRWLRFALDVSELCKLRVNVLVLITVAIGFLLASPIGGVRLALLGHAMLGIFLLGCSSSAFNQLMEIRYDRLMQRTRDRPLAAGRFSIRWALLGSMAATAMGTAYLLWQVNVLTAALGALSLFAYLAVYTPMKRKTPMALHIGAVAGALPPVMGWAAAAGSLGTGAYLLFAILFLWQIPHFHAIAWMYRKDYDQGGFRMLAVVRPRGMFLPFETVTITILMILASVGPAYFELTAPWFGWFAGAFGACFLLIASLFAFRRTQRSARWVLYGSIIYLPALLLVWVFAAV